MPTPQRPIVSALRFLALTALGLVGIEYLVRLTPVSPYGFWREVDATVATRPLDFLFVGSSQTGAAIAPDAVRDFFPDKPALNVVNAGMGYTTTAERFLALRNTLGAHAANLRNCTLFLESLKHGPDFATWSEPWCPVARPDILSPLLRAEDVSRFWTGPHPFEDKLKLTFDWLLQPWVTYSRALTVGKQRSELPQKYLAPLLQKILLRPDPLMPTESKLTNVGGIRADEEGMALARAGAQRFVESGLRDQEAIDWRNTIVADIVHLARSHRIQVVFFTPPQHSLIQPLSDTPTRRADRANFQTLCNQWETPFLEPEFPSSDEDFPDVWHLQKSRAPAYTKALMESWQRLPKR